MKNNLMKNNCMRIFLVWMILTASIFANSTCKIILNGIIYTPIHTPIITEDGLFLSTDDLGSITFSNFEIEGEDLTWHFNDTSYKLSTNSRSLSYNTKVDYLTALPIKKAETIYLPVTILKSVGVNYLLGKDNKVLELGTTNLYSRYKDTYSSHTLLETEYLSLDEVFSPIVPNSSVVVNHAKKYNQYLCLASGTHKKELLNHFEKISGESLPLEVVFREFQSFSSPHTLKGSEILPLKLNISDDGLTLNFGDTTEDINLIYSAYSWAQKSNTMKIDIDKSLDVTIMRQLYEHFRDSHNLKDDISFSPITSVQNGVFDYISYGVYSDHFTDHTPTYTVTVSKQILKNKIRYVVDISSTLPPLS